METIRFVDHDGKVWQFQPHLTLTNKQVIANIHVNEASSPEIYVLQDGIGWRCFVHDGADYRRRLHWHPAYGSSPANVIELMRFPMYLGRKSGYTFPSAHELRDWYTRFMEVEELWGNGETYADCLAEWLENPLSPDDWLWLNNYWDSGKR